MKANNGLRTFNIMRCVGKTSCKCMIVNNFRKICSRIICKTRNFPILLYLNSTVTFLRGQRTFCIENSHNFNKYENKMLCKIPV